MEDELNYLSVKIEEAQERQSYFAGEIERDEDSDQSAYLSAAYERANTELELLESVQAFITAQFLLCSPGKIKS